MQAVQLQSPPHNYQKHSRLPPPTWGMAVTEQTCSPFALPQGLCFCCVLCWRALPSFFTAAAQDLLPQSSSDQPIYTNGNLSPLSPSPLYFFSELDSFYYVITWLCYISSAKLRAVPSRASDTWDVVSAWCTVWTECMYSQWLPPCLGMHFGWILDNFPFILSFPCSSAWIAL